MRYLSIRSNSRKLLGCSCNDDDPVLLSTFWKDMWCFMQFKNALIYCHGQDPV